MLPTARPSVAESVHEPLRVCGNLGLAGGLAAGTVPEGGGTTQPALAWPAEAEAAGLLPLRYALTHLVLQTLVEYLSLGGKSSGAKPG